MRRNRTLLGESLKVEADLSARDCLASGSPVARALPGFRPREEQLAMAAAVEEALAEGYHLAVEAGTGVGKSFGYLVPVLLRLARGGGPVLVATRTIALQEQLLEKDLPLLVGALRLEGIRVALAKGRGNYVCQRRLRMARGEGRGLFGRAEEREQLDRLAAWAAESVDGSLSDLSFRPLPQVWEAVCAEQGNCLNRRCAYFERCGYQRSRREMRAAQLIIANHALVFTDLAIREAGATFLPEYEAIVLDEAHEIEEGAAENFGAQASAFAIQRQLARFTGRRRRGGLFEKVEAPRDLYDRVEETLEATKKLFDGLTLLRGDAPERRIRTAGEFADPLSDPLFALSRRLREVHAEIGDLEAAMEWKTRADRLEAIAETVSLVRDVADSGLVYWIEAAGRRDSSVLRAAPVDIAETLRRTLFRKVRCAILTSATLRVAGTFDHFCRRIGLSEPKTLGLGSPFNFREQCRLILHPRLPDPREAAFDDAAIDRIRKLVLESRGGSFILYTSYKSLEKGWESLHEGFESAGLFVMRQGAGLRPKEILENFRKRGDCVLFATETFWQGVDVRGDNLRLVIMVKLPFAVPDHPLQQARIERIEEEGGDSFRELSLPQAVLKLRQGFGRLIRTHEDRGVVAILDPRICTKGYGKDFLKSLPDCAVERRD